MESIYYVLSWACHRRCRHCYEDRFRPYAPAVLRRMTDAARAAFPAIIANLPDRLDWLDPASPDPTAPEGARRRPGRVILAGGELLIDPVREDLLYPALDALDRRWPGQGVRVVVQTTGDLVTPAIIDDLLRRGVWMISCAGMDDHHVGMEGARRDPLVARLRAMFADAGLRDADARADQAAGAGEDDAPCYALFGATGESWIGKLWPRGRAWENGLTRATLADNFCNAWSGGLNFLARGQAGSEVSIDPNGDVYPCCLKTRAPLGNLTEEPLDAILDSLTGLAPFAAISAGAPERMGIAHGWSEARFLDECRTVTPQGEAYANLCIGCDRFHDAVLGPLLADLRAARLATRRAAGATPC